MSLVPVVIWTSISLSPGSILIALMPLERGLAYWERAVFLTVPPRVLNNKNPPFQPELAHRDDGANLGIGLHVDQVDDRLSPWRLGRPEGFRAL